METALDQYESHKLRLSRLESVWSVLLRLLALSLLSVLAVLVLVGVRPAIVFGAVSLVLFGFSLTKVRSARRSTQSELAKAVRSQLETRLNESIEQMEAGQFESAEATLEEIDDEATGAKAAAEEVSEGLQKDLHFELAPLEPRIERLRQTIATARQLEEEVEATIEALEEDLAPFRSHDSLELEQGAERLLRAQARTETLERLAADIDHDGESPFSEEITAASDQLARAAEQFTENILVPEIADLQQQYERYQRDSWSTQQDRPAVWADLQERVEVAQETIDQLEITDNRRLNEEIVQADDSLEGVKQVGPKRAQQLRSAGYQSRSELASASVSSLKRIDGIGHKTATAIIDDAEGYTIDDVLDHLQSEFKENRRRASGKSSSKSRKSSQSEKKGQEASGQATEPVSEQNPTRQAGGVAADDAQQESTNESVETGTTISDDIPPEDTSKAEQMEKGGDSPESPPIGASESELQDHQPASSMKNQLQADPDYDGEYEAFERFESGLDKRANDTNDDTN